MKTEYNDQTLTSSR